MIGIVENWFLFLISGFYFYRKNPENGPWTVIPNEEVFESFMKNCSNRTLRKTLYETYYSRASYLNEQFQTNNSEIIKGLLEYRTKQANLYGFKNFAELVIENKAAVKVDNVIDLFERLIFLFTN